jgi:hypothetical protein
VWTVGIYINASEQHTASIFRAKALLTTYRCTLCYSNEKEHQNITIIFVRMCVNKIFNKNVRQDTIFELINYLINSVNVYKMFRPFGHLQVH